MTREERELSIEYLEGIKDNYIEGHGYERHPIPEYYAIENAIKALEQQDNTWSLDDAREDFIHDVYNTLDFLPTNNEANRIIDSFDRVTKHIKQEECEDCISRQAVLDALDKRFDKIPMEQTTEILKLRKDLRGLSSIKSEQKKGRWIYGEDEYGIDGYHCEQCGFFVPWDYTHKFINYIEDYKFCPNCGAKMIEPQESEE